jgi:hypothetical protein
MNSSINNNNNMTSWATIAKSPKVLNTAIAPIDNMSLDNEKNLVDLDSSTIIPDVIPIPSINLGVFGVSKPKKIKQKKINFPLKSDVTIESTENLVLSVDIIQTNNLKSIDDNLKPIGDNIIDMKSTEPVDSVICVINESINSAEILEKSEVDQIVKITKTTYVNEVVEKEIELIFESHIIQGTNVVTKDSNIIIKDIIIDNDKKIVESERLFALELCENMRNIEISSFAHLKAEPVRVALYNSLETIDLDSAIKLSNKIYKTVYEKWYTDRRNSLKLSNIMNRKAKDDTIDNSIISVITNKDLPPHQLHGVIDNLATNKVVIENNLLNIIDTPIQDVENKSSYLTISKKKCVDIKKVAVKDDTLNKNKSIVKGKLIINKNLSEANTKQTPEERTILSNVKKEEILSAAKLYAQSLINFDEIIAARDSKDINWRGCLHTIDIDCHHTKLGVTKNGMPIFPRNFLDNTFIAGTAFSTNSHQIFRKEFLIVLEERVSDLHVRFEKDTENSLLFTIKFYNKRESY